MGFKEEKQVHRKPSIIIGVIGEDPHIIGSKILARVLEAEGFRVTHIGAKCQPREFIEAAIETHSDAILISSVSGHARFYCRDFRQICDEAGLKDVVIYAGGNLIMEADDWGQVEREYVEMGINRVYPPGTKPSLVVEDLKGDLGIKVTGGRGSEGMR
jgi:methylaspartate mutase sigma subunit